MTALCRSLPISGGALAKHYSTWDSERVFFEILNEPEFPDRYRWYGVQAKLASAIREGAPQNTHDRSGSAVVERRRVSFS